MITLFGIANCDSCRKARKYLEQHAVPFHFHDLRVDGIDAGLIHGWLKASGNDLTTLINRRSTTWRQLSEADRARTDNQALINLLITHPTLVKRPLLQADGVCLMGFSTASYNTFATA